jgi:hypothetical protein
MQFSKGLFWDLDCEKLDFQEHKTQVIPRVFMKGTLDDIIQALRYYGKEQIKSVLLQTRYLDEKTLALAAVFFNADKQDFRCYKLSQSTPQLWNY